MQNLRARSTPLLILGGMALVASFAALWMIGALTSKPLNSLGLITIVVFVWYWCAQRDMKAGISVIAAYAALAIPGVLLGWMNTYAVFPFALLMGIMLLGDWVIATPSTALTLIVVLMLNGVGGALYLLQLMDPAYALSFGASSIAMFVVRFLRRHK